jgi:hypothetical protein
VTKKGPKALETLFCKKRERKKTRKRKEEPSKNYFLI